MPQLPVIRMFFKACGLTVGLCFFLLSPCLAASSATSIKPGQAAAMIGKRATVCGKVANTYYSCFVSKKPTFINFGKPYPDQVFSIAILAEDRGNFGDCPEKLFAGRDVCVTGLIESYKGKPVMKVKDQSQVKWND
jgi:hypothetical protein